MMLRIVRKLMNADILGLFLVVLALEVFVYGVSSSLRDTEIDYFFYVCVIAALIGLGLGKGKSQPIQASVAIVALGVASIWILGARIANPLMDLIRSIISTILHVIPAIRFKTTVDTSSIINSWSIIADASINLSLRFQTWLVGFSRNVSVNDELVRGMVWLLLHWLVAAWAGWFAARRNAIGASGMRSVPCCRLHLY